MKSIRHKHNNKGRVPFYITLFSLLFTLGSLGSCQDMIETDNDSMVSAPDLNSKTDSVFYALGIAQAMQQLADQYYYVGEMRGELVTVDEANTDKNLKELANYSAGTTNAVTECKRKTNDVPHPSQESIREARHFSQLHET